MLKPTTPSFTRYFAVIEDDKKLAIADAELKKRNEVTDMNLANIIGVVAKEVLGIAESSVTTTANEIVSLLRATGKNVLADMIEAAEKVSFDFAVNQSAEEAQQMCKVLSVIQDKVLDAQTHIATMNTLRYFKKIELDVTQDQIDRIRAILGE
jgi:hypothetical protein